MCKLLKVSRSGYYKYINKTPSKRSVENEALKEYITDIHNQFKMCYGYRRVKIELDVRGIIVNHKRVYRIMRECGLSGKHPRKKHGNYKKVQQDLIKDNILMQDFSADMRNKTWVGDITYIPTKEGFLYLMAYMDVYTRKIVGWSMDKNMREQLVLDALESAICSEAPGEGLIVHTDRGTQFIGKRYQAEIEKHGIVPSMSNAGNPYDNAIMESFNKSLKTEMMDNNKVFATREEAKKAIFEYIELFYNRKRRHSSLGYLSPLEYEKLNLTK
jgi:putative transposase